MKLAAFEGAFRNSFDNKVEGGFNFSKLVHAVRNKKLLKFS